MHKFNPYIVGMARAGSKPKAKSFFQRSHVGAGAQELGPSAAAFAGALAGSWIGSTGSNQLSI